MKPRGGEGDQSAAVLFSLLLRSPATCVASPEESCSSSFRFLRDYVAWEFNAVCWISLFAVTYFLLRKVLRLFKLWIQARKIPGPPCPRFSGHCEFLSRESLTDVLATAHKKYGSVIKLWLGPTSLLVSVKDPELIQDVLLKAEDKLPLTGKAFRLAFGQSSLFASSFNKVAKRRQCLARVLNQRLLDRATVVSTKAVDSIIERVSESMTKESVDSRKISQHMAFTLLGTSLFGDAFLDWSKATVYAEILTMIAKDACFWASYSVTPFWKREFWRYQQLCTKLKCLTQDILQQCRKNYKLLCKGDEIFHDKSVSTQMGKISGFPKQPGGPSCSGFSISESIFLKGLTGHLEPREEPCGNIMGVMFHGFLTTAGLIDNILARLVTHPEIQDSIYTELRLARKASTKQDQCDGGNMPLLLATIYESARLLPAGPLLQRCSMKHDLSLKNGVIIPAGAIVVVPVQLVQTDDSRWGSDAYEFNPYRFLSKGSDLVHNTSCKDAVRDGTETSHRSFIASDPKQDAAFLPFGSGTRSCLGEKFVIQEVARLFASLLESYEIRVQPGSDKNPNQTPATNNCLFHLLPSPDIVFVQRNG